MEALVVHGVRAAFNGFSARLMRTVDLSLLSRHLDESAKNGSALYPVLRSELMRVEYRSGEVIQVQGL